MCGDIRNASLRCSAQYAHGHLLWALALLSLILLLALSAALPAWRVLPGWAAPVAVPPVRDQAYDSPSPSPPFASLGFRRQPRMSPTATPATDQNVSLQSPSGLPESPTAEPPQLRLSQCLLLAWAVGTFLSLLLLALGLPGLWLLRRRARRVHVGPLADELIRLRTRLGVTRPVTLLMGPSGTMPMTWGARRPCILLPIEAGHWPADRPRARSVLLHEAGPHQATRLPDPPRWRQEQSAGDLLGSTRWRGTALRPFAASNASEPATTWCWRRASPGVRLCRAPAPRGHGVPGVPAALRLLPAVVQPMQPAGPRSKAA